MTARVVQVLRAIVDAGHRGDCFFMKSHHPHRECDCPYAEAKDLLLEIESTVVS